MSCRQQCGFTSISRRKSAKNLELLDIKTVACLCGKKHDTYVQNS